MTAQAVEAVAEPFAGIRRSWSASLTDRLSPTWRPGEWDAATEIFLGDWTNPATWVFHCSVAACPRSTAGNGSLCASCSNRWHKAGKPSDFETLWVPTRQRSDVDRARRFDLGMVAASLRTEMLFALQVLDADRVLVPERVHQLLARIPAGLSSLLDLPDDVTAAMPAGSRGLVRSMQSVLSMDHLRFTGADPTKGDVWECRLVGLTASTHRRYVARTGALDFRPIHQAWLREAAKEYLRVLRPTVQNARKILTAVSTASDALLARPNGDQPTKLAMPDMVAIVDHLQLLCHPDGRPLSESHRAALFARLRQMLTFLRQSGSMDHVPDSFTAEGRFELRRSKPAHRGTEAEDLLGRSIPDHVIAQLDDHLHLLGTHSGFASPGWSVEDVRHMYRTVYQLIRDTGRRPDEVATLKIDCLTYIDGKPTLIYDNHKARRHGRRLPIAESTAAIVTEWLGRLARLPTEKVGRWMFPSPGQRGRTSGTNHLSAGVFGGRVFRRWVDAIPALVDEGLDRHGLNTPYPRERVVLYGFRHSYAQRHADAGTPVDVLRQLMDHVSIETTMGYYKVTLKRRREAVATVADLTVDRHGRRLPPASELDYGIGSVAVPYGNCAEPSNVKAGGGHCPIRFQCAGCAFYRPDPSYLPAIDTHIAELRVNKEQALATDVATWVIKNLDDQIGAFTGVATAMHTLLDQLPDENRRIAEQAGKDVRRIRQADAATTGGAFQ